MNDAEASRPDLSLVIPVYNERDKPAPALGADPRGARHRRAARTRSCSSTTARPTAAARRWTRWRASTRRCGPIHFARRTPGRARAIAAGFRLARAPIVVTLDADSERFPRTFRRSCASWRTREPGRRRRDPRRERGTSLVRKVSSMGRHYWVRNTLTKDHVTDPWAALLQGPTAKEAVMADQDVSRDAPVPADAHPDRGLTKCSRCRCAHRERISRAFQVRDREPGATQVLAERPRWCAGCVPGGGGGGRAGGPGR
jgi:hypothetical protein